MGLFDYVHVRGGRFLCPDGHPVHEFQTYDLGSTMGDAVINGDAFDFAPGPAQDHDRIPSDVAIEMHGHCEACPAFVQNDTYNLRPFGVVFRVTIAAGAVVKVESIGETVAEFLAREPNEACMANCHGPMSYADAHHLHVYSVGRPRRPWWPPTATPPATKEA